MTYGKTQTEITISEVQRAVNALKKAAHLLEGNEVLNETKQENLDNIIETCEEFLYTKAVESAQQKYLHGKPLC